MLKIEKLRKVYAGGKVAVERIDLEIKDGEIFGFIGHNGAGKTTTIKCVVGILSFEEGHIFVNGKNIKDDPIECKRIVAYIPDNPDLYELLTGIQYLHFICDLYKIAPSDRMARITEYASDFEIDKNLGDMIQTYSHGMKQKLALISALIRKPKLLILDEPFVGLDPRAAFRVKEIMRKMCDEGSSIFFSTHVLDVAEKICDKVAIIQKGKIVACGTMEEVRGNKSLEDVFLELGNYA